MGWKGPVIILIMGVLGLVGLGLMADMLARNPETQAVLAFKQATAETFPVKRVDLAPRGRELGLTLWMDRADFRAPRPTGLPQGFETLEAFLGENYRMKRIRTVEVEFRDNDTDATLRSHSIKISKRARSIRREIEVMLNTKVTIRTLKGSKLRLEIPGGTRTTPEQISEIARMLRDFKSRDWSGIEIRTGKKSLFFDGLGKPLQTR